MAVHRINITISDPLYQLLQKHKDGLNVSGICQKALERELRYLDTVWNSAEIKEISDGDRAEIISRLREERGRRVRHWSDLGYRLGLMWARTEASELELRAIRSCGYLISNSLGFGTNEVVDPIDRQITMRVFLQLRKTALTDRTQQPLFDQRAFEAGIVRAATQIWELFQAAESETTDK